MSELNLILLGPPGSGKGTQGERLQEDFRLPYYATGDILRAAVSEGTELGKTAKAFMDKGDLVPDEVIIGVIGERVENPEAADGFILDGFPRTLEQAQALDQALGPQSVDKALYIEVTDEELVKRLSGRWLCRNCQAPYHMTNNPPQHPGSCDHCGGELYQRADDTEETVRKRIEVYLDQTAPLIDYYAKASKLIRVDGEQDIDAVARDVLAMFR